MCRRGARMRDDPKRRRCRRTPKEEGRFGLKRPLRIRESEKSDSGVQLILLRSRRGSGSRTIQHALRIVFNELLLPTVTIGGVEIEVEHLLVNLVVIPMIVIEAVNRSHHARAVTAAGAVYVELAGFRIVDEFEERRDLLFAGIVLVRNRNVHVLHALRFHVASFAIAVIGQVNYGTNAEFLERGKFLFFGTGAAIEAVVHLPEI